MAGNHDWQQPCDMFLWGEMHGQKHIKNTALQGKDEPVYTCINNLYQSIRATAKQIWNGLSPFEHPYKSCIETIPPA